MRAAMATRALVLAEWQYRWNRGWRFSPRKSLLWSFLFQVGLVGLALWRFGAVLSDLSPTTALLLALAQAGLGNFLIAFVRGREQLYNHRIIPLVQLSPAPGASAILAQVGMELPNRLWGATLLSLLLFGSVPVGDRLWALPALWVLALAGGALGQLGGLLALVTWARLAPRLLGYAWAGMMGGMVVLYGYLFYVALTTSPADIGQRLVTAQILLVALVLAVAGIPGLLMGLWVGLNPRKAGEVYRQGWLRLRELADGESRPLRSRMPAVVPRSAGTIQAVFWLRTWRNHSTYMRIGLWLVPLIGVALLGSGLEDPTRSFFILGVSLGVAVFALLEVAASVFSGDGARLWFLVLTGVRPARVLLGKVLGLAPLPLLVGLGAAVVGLLVGGETRELLAFGLLGGGIGLGMVLVTAGWAAAGLSLPDLESSEETHPLLEAVYEQIPKGLGGWLGYLAGTLYAAGGAWVCSGMGGASLLWVWALWVLPVLSLVAGYLRLCKLLRWRPLAR